ncbi:MAG: hypothetical protein CBARDMAM_4315 [uncultured Caballeronia sp.]|nr:MAG: hypothetical protein CBARDMAM_4315 [uncultured Caballeronia sp.]
MTDGTDRLSDGAKIQAAAARPTSGASGAPGQHKHAPPLPQSTQPRRSRAHAPMNISRLFYS